MLNYVQGRSCSIAGQKQAWLLAINHCATIAMHSQSFHVHFMYSIELFSTCCHKASRLAVKPVGFSMVIDRYDRCIAWTTSGTD